MLAVKHGHLDRLDPDVIVSILGETQARGHALAVIITLPNTIALNNGHAQTGTKPTKTNKCRNANKTMDAYESRTHAETMPTNKLLAIRKTTTLSLDPN